MASSLTPTGETLAVNAVASGTYVSLHTSAAGTNPPTNEVSTSGTAYARQAVTFTNTGSNPTVAQNSTVINYSQATAAWGTLNQFAVWDALTGGNMRGWGDLTTAKAVNIGDTASFPINSLTISVT